MTQTQFLMTGKSTKNMNFANTKTASRSYKMIGRTDRGCSVDVKVGGRVKGTISFSVKFSKLIPTGSTVNGITPLDVTEATMIAKKALKIA